MLLTILKTFYHITPFEDDDCMFSNYEENITVEDSKKYVNIEIEQGTKYLIIQDYLANNLILNGNIVPYVLYNVHVNRNIIAQDGPIELYIDSLSMTNFIGDFIGEWKFIKVYSHDMFDFNNVQSFINETNTYQ